ncbi:MAG: FAD:protein FMN transferase [Candidatus Eisenbacteria bacterium]|uniref:FAD:protein FMN transferase n=1 Tax=Eiseniibacteriota bacterium TaxID=2212470 RepID=A0A933SDB0_UNCEI|nr:FAD:protein FMN transferase [Candidatus Eisenbacteria bacterium]
MVGGVVNGNTPRLERLGDVWAGRFTAMASPCEVLVDTDHRRVAADLVRAARTEARRIEKKFSRYRDDSVVHDIQAARGTPWEPDAETARLLGYAAACFELSGGSFDVTSGVLRRAWRFDGGEASPDETVIAEALLHVGWLRVTWDGRTLVLPEGMELDFGGIGKEYAVDSAAALLAERSPVACLVNFGGDLVANAPRRGGAPWIVGVDDPERTGEGVVQRIELERGALATSGDARRYVTWRGRRLGHILDPRTGWPVVDAPRAVTVLAATCIEAGTLATLAILQGRGARAFLEAQGVTGWVVDA